MQEAITYVGIDAHKKNLAIAMLVGHERTPTTWTDVLQLSKSGKRAIGRVGLAPSHAATSNKLLMN